MADLIEKNARMESEQKIIVDEIGVESEQLEE
jgi:hypothetical protein